MKKFIVLLMVLGLALIAVPMAQAVIIDFTVPGNNPTGAVSYAGGATALSTFFGAVEHPITITQVETLLPATGPFAITNGELTFTTGLFSAALSDPEHWGFGAGGSLTIAGDIGAFSGTILSGTFTQMLVSKADPGTGFSAMVANFTDLKDPDFLAEINVPPSEEGFVGNFNIGMKMNLVAGLFPAPNDPFTSQIVTSGDVTNNFVPVPPAVWLLGSGLIGLVGLRRRIKK